ASVDRDIHFEIMHEHRDIPIAFRPSIVKSVEGADQPGPDLAIVGGPDGDSDQLETGAVVQFEQLGRQVGHRMLMEAGGYVRDSESVMSPTAVVPEWRRPDRYLGGNVSPGASQLQRRVAAVPE